MALECQDCLITLRVQLQQCWWLPTDIQQYGMHLGISKTIFKFFLLEKGVEPHFSVQ